MFYSKPHCYKKKISEQISKNKNYMVKQGLWHKLNTGVNLFLNTHCM